MNDDERYHAWKRRHAEAPLPGDFADRVMAAVRGCERPRPNAAQRLLVLVLSSRLGKVGLVTLACLACAFRALNILALFYAS